MRLSTLILDITDSIIIDSTIGLIEVSLEEDLVTEVSVMDSVEDHIIHIVLEGHLSNQQEVD